jgi:RNA polymerase sigma-70 factor (ECF subfamily)
MEDIRIIRRIKNGDVDAFSKLVEKYHQRLLTFIFRLVRDEGIVEDIGQEVFLDIYKSLKGFDENRGTPFSAWLFIAARNRCISELRKKNASVALSLEEVGELAGDNLSAEALLMAHERSEALRFSLEVLAKPFKEPLLMSLHGCTLQEISRACGISPGTVKSRLFRARERMKLLIERHLGGKGYESV